MVGKALATALNLPSFIASPFTILVTLTHPETEQDFMVLTQIPEANFQLRKIREKGGYKVVGDNNNQVNAALKRVPSKKFRQVGSCPPSLVAHRATMALTCELASVYVAGRYLKFTRGLSHTPWLINGQKQTEGSIEEIVMERIKVAFKCNRKLNPFILVIFSSPWLIFFFSSSSSFIQRPPLLRLEGRTLM